MRFEGSLELKRIPSMYMRRKRLSMLKISYAVCRGLPPGISVQFNVKMDIAAYNTKITKTHFFEFQGSSRSSLLDL